jgi:hypothetical protein
MFQLTVAIIKHFQKNFIETVIDFLNYLEFFTGNFLLMFFLKRPDDG